MLAGDLDCQDFNCLPREVEVVVLRTLIETFISRAWCLRRPCDGTALLTFPSHLRHERKERADRMNRIYRIIRGKKWAGCISNSHFVARGAAVPAASPDSVSLFKASRGGTPHEFAGEDACATST